MADVTYGREWITVVNRALVLLGKSGMDSLDDVTDPAANSRIMVGLPLAVTYVLTAHPWQGMARYVALSPLAGETWGPDGENVFELPEDCMAVIDRWSSHDFHRIAGDRLASKSGTVSLAYIRNPETPEEMPPALVNTVSSYLAYLLAQSLTGSTEMQQLMSSQFAADYAVALREDGWSDTERCGEDGETVWTEAR